MIQPKLKRRASTAPPTVNATNTTTASTCSDSKSSIGTPLPKAATNPSPIATQPVKQLIKSRWSQEEDKRLTGAVREMRDTSLNWKTISQRAFGGGPGRTCHYRQFSDVQCWHRWTNVLNQGGEHNRSEFTHNMGTRVPLVAKQDPEEAAKGNAGGSVFTHHMNKAADMKQDSEETLNKKNSDDAYTSDTGGTASSSPSSSSSSSTPTIEVGSQTVLGQPTLGNGISSPSSTMSPSCTGGFTHHMPAGSSNVKQESEKDNETANGDEFTHHMPVG